MFVKVACQQISEICYIAVDIVISYPCIPVQDVHAFFSFSACL